MASDNNSTKPSSENNTEYKNSGNRGNIPERGQAAPSTPTTKK